MNIHDFYAEAQSINEWIVNVRRSLHRIPESGFQEFKTQAFICRTLDELGIPYTTERTWTVATIKGALPGDTVALRADIDALPITEPDTLPFHSEHPGWMHACGHDAHTAVQLGAAKLIMNHLSELKGTVKLFFQPAEETDGGAEPMVQAGVMEGVDAVYGLHVQPYLNVGRIDSCMTTLNASTDEIELTVHGVSGHAARPHLGVDALLCACQMVVALQTVVSRSVSPLKSAVLSLGTIEGGVAQNVICDEVKIRGTLRTLDPEIRDLCKKRIREICEGVASAFGATVDVNIIPGYCALINAPSEVERVFGIARDLLGEENVLLRDEPSMGGEDFSYFVREAPGAFYHLGCSTQQPCPALHVKDFVLDERCLPIGSALQCAIVFDRLNGGTKA